MKISLGNGRDEEEPAFRSIYGAIMIIICSFATLISTVLPYCSNIQDTPC